MNIYEEARKNSRMTSTDIVLLQMLRKYSTHGKINVNFSQLSREANRSSNFYLNALHDLEKFGYVKRIGVSKFGATLTVVK